MQDLRDRMQAAQSLLAPYAVPIAGFLGRGIAEPPDSTRFPFQRDRDRIIHCTAFRRLKGKTQVFVAPEGDHYRTRLSHTLEVTQLSRDIARTLQLNEDLAECIALGHDLGHPPFGHAGEDALDAWMKRSGHRFEHNRQSHRIVSILENRSSLHIGLNLNREVLDGLKKHWTPHDDPDEESSASPSANLEAQVVNLADEIAYTAHDTDDGLRAGLFSPEELRGIAWIRKAKEGAEEGRSIRSAIIHMLVADLYRETERNLASGGIVTLDDILRCRKPTVQFGATTQHDLAELREFLWQHMYLSPSVRTKSREGQNILRALCDRYREHPPEKVLELQTRTGGALEEAIADYVSGMTDDYAAKAYQSRETSTPSTSGR